jgi:hypothetical protein
MHRLGTLTLGNLGSNDAFILKNVKKGKRIRCIKLRLHAPIVVANAIAAVAADLNRLLQHFFAGVKLSHGPERKLIAIDGIDGGELRTLQRFMTQNEVPNDFVGTTPTAAAHTFEATLAYYFAPTWQKGVKRYPGSSQVANMEIEVNESNTDVAAGGLGLTRGVGNATIDVIVEYLPGPDKVAPVISYRKLDQARLDVQGPDGLTLAMFDNNAAHDATAIGDYNFSVGAEQVIFSVKPKEIGQLWREQLDAGGSDPLDTVTLTYSVDPQADTETWPTGPAKLELLNQDVATQKARVLYYPHDGEATERKKAEDIATRNETTVLLERELPTHPDAVPGAAAFMPATIRTPGDNAFRSAAGLMAPPQGTAQVVVPDHLRQQLAAGVRAASVDAQPSVAGRLANQLAMRIPGALSSMGERTGAGGVAINDLVTTVAAPPTQAVH